MACVVQSTLNKKEMHEMKIQMKVMRTGVLCIVFLVAMFYSASALNIKHAPAVACDCEAQAEALAEAVCEHRWGVLYVQCSPDNSTNHFSFRCIDGFDGGTLCCSGTPGEC